MARRTHPLPWLLLLGLATACGDPGQGLQLAEPAADDFADTVYPVLLRDCGFPACHGDPDRFFRVFGPGRQRVMPELAPLDPATPTEISLSYERARSMVDLDSPLTSLLLEKPMDGTLGGASHEGVDDFGRDIYVDADDPNLVILRNWVLTAAQTPPPPGTPTPTIPTQGVSP